MTIKHKDPKKHALRQRSASSNKPESQAIVSSDQKHITPYAKPSADQIIKYEARKLNFRNALKIKYALQKHPRFLQKVEEIIAEYERKVSDLKEIDEESTDREWDEIVKGEKLDPGAEIESLADEHLDKRSAFKAAEAKLTDLLRHSKAPEELKNITGRNGRNLLLTHIMLESRLPQLPEGHTPLSTTAKPRGQLVEYMRSLGKRIGLSRYLGTSKRAQRKQALAETKRILYRIVNERQKPEVLYESLKNAGITSPPYGSKFLKNLAPFVTKYPYSAEVFRQLGFQSDHLLYALKKQSFETLLRVFNETGYTLDEMEYAIEKHYPHTLNKVYEKIALATSTKAKLPTHSNYLRTQYRKLSLGKRGMNLTTILYNDGFEAKKAKEVVTIASK